MHPTILKPSPTPLPLVVLLGVLIALPALGTDLFVPALPALTQALGTEVGAGQLMMTLYFIGLAAGQLAWGPLSDRYGRKPILLAGLGIMLAASLAAMLMETLAAVIAARLAQGLGMASGALIGRTIARDLYAHEQAAKLLSSMSVVFSIVPLAAPLAGGLLADAAGWPSVFAAMAAIAVALLVAVVPLRETAPARRAPASPRQIMRTFAGILGDRRFLGPYSVFLCTQIGVLAWVSNSSFTLISGLGVGPTAYGAMFTLVMSGQIIGAWMSSRLVLRLGIPRMLRWGAALMLAGGACAAGLAWLGVGHWLAVVAPFVLSRAMRKVEGWQDLARPTRNFGIVLIAALAVTGATTGTAVQGWTQRGAIVLVALGVSSLAWRVLRLESRPVRTAGLLAGR